MIKRTNFNINAFQYRAVRFPLCKIGFFFFEFILIYLVKQKKKQTEGVCCLVQIFTLHAKNLYDYLARGNDKWKKHKTHQF